MRLVIDRGIKLGGRDARLSEFPTGDFGPGQNCLAEVGAGQVGGTEICVGEVLTGEVKTCQTIAVERNPSQIVCQITGRGNELISGDPGPGLKSVVISTELRS